MGKVSRHFIHSSRLHDVAKEIELASQMILLGARLQVLKKEISLDGRRLRQLYRELKKKNPPGGMLPFSADWYLGWLPNIHSSFFYTTYSFLTVCSSVEPRQALVDGYRLYLEYAAAGRVEGLTGRPVLCFTRAWVLLRYIERGLLKLSTCKACEGSFLTPIYQLYKQFVCGICKPPNRAGATLLARQKHQARSVS